MGRIADNYRAIRLRPLMFAFAIAFASGQAAFADCEVLERNFDKKSEQTFALSPTTEATLLQMEGDDLVYISEAGKTVFSGDFGEVEWNLSRDTGLPQVLAVDVNDDGIRDLFVGVGQGMVSNYYQMLISQPNGQWKQGIEVSNPEFSCGEPGFTGWYRSGPRGTDEYWAIGEDGIPYVQISRTVVDDHIFQRVDYDAQGKVIARAIVPYTKDIRTETPPVTAKAVEGASVYSPDDMQTEISKLAADTPLILLEVDDTYSLMLVEFGPDKKRGWVVIEDIAYE